MGLPLFGNEFFDQWLNQKSNEILSKVEREKITNEDMLFLSLKAQVNHFHHMDVEFREEFKKIDRRFDKLTTLLTWGVGLFVSTQIAVLYKLFM